MPRLPTRQGPAPIRLTVPRGTAAQGAAIGASALAQGADEVFLAERQLQDEREFLSATSDISQALNELRLQIEQSDDPAAAESFRSGADAIIADRAGGVASESVRNAIAGSFARRIEASDLALRAKAQQQREALQAESLTSALQSIQTGFTLADTDIEQALLLQEGARLIEFHGQSAGLSAAERKSAIRNWRSDTARLAVGELLKSEPESTMERLRDPSQFTDLRPADRATLLNAAEVEANQLRSDRARLENERQAAAARDFLVRMDSDDPSDYPTTAEIASARLDVGITDQLIDQRRALSNGARANEVNHFVLSDLFNRVIDSERPDHITDAAQFLPFVRPGGINTASLLTLTNLLENQAGTDPVRSEQRRRLASVYKTIDATMDKSNLLLGTDALGTQAAGRYKTIVSDRYLKGLEEGKDPLDLTNPDHADYIATDIANAIPTRQEQQDSLFSIFGQMGLDPDTAVDDDGSLSEDAIKAILQSLQPETTQ